MEYGIQKGVFYHLGLGIAALYPLGLALWHVAGGGVRKAGLLRAPHHMPHAEEPGHLDIQTQFSLSSLHRILVHYTE